MQSNAEAFLSFGMRGRALRLIRGGMVSILGSDAITSRTAARISPKPGK
jgi:hypothetical protein